MHFAVLAMMVGCDPAHKTEPSADSASHTDSGTPAVEEGPLTHRFGVAVIADPHIVGPGEHENRLNAAVDWVEANAAALDLQLVVVLGDICWGEGFGLAHQALDRLTMPWVPVMGDNVIQTGGESTFHATFSTQLAALESELTGFSVAPTPVYNPERDVDSWLQNMVFDFGGVRFIAADWNSREIHRLFGDTPDLHDFDGGTWPWLNEQLAATSGRLEDSVVLLSHMPLFEGPGGLTTVEADAMVPLLASHQDAIWANLAGHLHVDTSMDWERAGIEVHVTDATWDDINRVRVVQVSANEHRFSYDHWVEGID